ncbi:MAG TPA: ice-binding family protein [Candidatus Dormibacteraeota bacterium]|nr:ice-binding family protein [Candidatus Dormibacteraeota bacterium]
MKRTRRLMLATLFSILFVGANSLVALAATDPGLGGAANFAVLAGTTITNTGPSWITGAIGAGAAGIAPGSFPPGTAGPQHVNDGVYTTAQTNLTTAYANAVQTCTTDYSGVNLGGLTLGPGVYCQTTAPTLTGTLTLNGSGVYIFLIGTTAAPTTLVTASGSKVVLIGGAQPCQVYWRVTTSATLNTTTQFVGTIMANAGIQMLNRATLYGRALARTAAVTLDTNRIIQPSGCGYTAPGAVAAPTGNTLPATLPPTAAVVAPPSSGGGPLQGDSFPWILALVAGVLAGAGAVRAGLTIRGYRRRT